MELNQDQIIKALKCCTKDDCDNCPNSFGNCYSNLAKYALALINELTEENERLRESNAGFALACLFDTPPNEDCWNEVTKKARDYEKLEKENERLERICHSYALQYGTATDKEVFLKKERADTVRKMVELIKERCIKGGIYPAFVASTIDQIAKEMEEGKD